MHQRFEEAEVSQVRQSGGEPAPGWREQRFHAKEVSEILSIATRLQSEGVKGEQILQMAEEAGIAPEFVERAVIEFQKRKWQRLEAELQLRRRLRRLLMAGGVLIALAGVFALWALMGSRASSLHASSASRSPLPAHQEILVMNDFIARGERRYSPVLAAQSQSVSVTTQRVMTSFTPRVDIIIRRAGVAQAVKVSVPTYVITQVSIAPDEQRIVLIDEGTGGVWVVNADGTGLSQIMSNETGLPRGDGSTLQATLKSFAGWAGGDPILHTDKGTLRIRLSEGNTVTRVERYRPGR